MKKVLVCGSIALDMLGTYGGSFADYQARYPIEALNFSLQLKSLRLSFGGCGMNIVYGLKQFGVPCTPLSAAGENFNDHYRAHLLGLGVDIDYIAVDEEYPQCATAIVLSDELGNQITGFYPGASGSPLRKLPREVAGIEDVAIAVLAPEDAPIMLRQARDLADLGIPILFDPGQGITAFTCAEVRELLSLSDYVVANLHEWEILQLNAEMSAEDIIRDQHQVIVTRSENGVDVLREGCELLHVPAIRPERIVEVTGSGDAFRAGYVYGLVRGLDACTCARIGTLAAVYNLENPETQRYSFTHAEFAARFHAAFGEALP
ncbi:MAG: PfkB family carbohydrate kinase [Pseudomonadota bacterium]